MYIAPSSLSCLEFFYKGERHKRDKNPKPYSKYLGFLNPNTKVFRAIFLPFFFRLPEIQKRARCRGAETHCASCRRDSTTSTPPWALGDPRRTKRFDTIFARTRRRRRLTIRMDRTCPIRSSPNTNTKTEESSSSSSSGVVVDDDAGETTNPPAEGTMRRNGTKRCLPGERANLWRRR